MQVFLQESEGFREKDPKQRKKDLEHIFAWSYTWGLGAALEDKSKEFFDTTVRDVFKAVQFPNSGSVFDYWYDIRRDQKQFKHWDIKVEPFVYSKESSFFELMVPTSDTYKHRYCLEKLLTIEKSVFFTGDTGVGKSLVIQNTFDILKEDSNRPLQPININFSAQTDSKRV